MDEPWNVVLQPSLACQPKSEWHRQREAQRVLRRAQLNGTSDMAAHDKEVRASPERPKRQHIFNIHSEPGSMADYHSNRQLQVEQPFLYGPYLFGGESYQTPRTAENVNKSCAAAGGWMSFRNGTRVSGISTGISSTSCGSFLTTK